MKYLIHYGTPRHSGRYPWGSGENPYQNERKSLKKGSIRNTVSVDKKFEKRIQKGKISKLYTYDPDNKWDKSVYEGPFSYYLTALRYGYRKKVKSHKLEVKEDLKLASREERKKVFNDMLDNPEERDEIVKTIKHVQKMTPPPEYLDAYIKEYPNDTTYPWMKRIAQADFDKKDIDRDVAYDAFTRVLDSPDMYRSVNHYIDYMSKKYDAMIDDNNFDIYNKAHDPVIIFKVNEKLNYLGSVPIEDIDIYNNTRKVYKGLTDNKIAIRYGVCLKKNEWM